MEHDSPLYEPLRDLVNQDENTIERSLEWLLADLNGADGALPTNMEVDVEAQQTPQETINIQDHEDNNKEHDLPQIEGDITEPTTTPKPTYRLEVAIPEMPMEQRSQYSTVASHIIESVFGELPPDRGVISYRVEFTDGRQELVGGFHFIQGSGMWLALFQEWPLSMLLDIAFRYSVAAVEVVTKIQIGELLLKACLIHCGSHKSTLLSIVHPRTLSFYINPFPSLLFLCVKSFTFAANN
jgi:hypothetical protein